MSQWTSGTCIKNRASAAFSALVKDNLNDKTYFMMSLVQTLFRLIISRRSFMHQENVPLLRQVLILLLLLPHRLALSSIFLLASSATLSLAFDAPEGGFATCYHSSIYQSYEGELWMPAKSMRQIPDLLDFITTGNSLLLQIMRRKRKLPL